jgi:DNA primase
MAHLDLDFARAVSIVDVVGDYVPDLKRQGGDYMALCPFHEDKTASFTVNEEKGVFRCFGCGESGDVIAFVRAIEGLDFRAAVLRIIDDFAGVLTPDNLIKRAAAREKAQRQQELDDAQKAKTALEIWKAAQPAAGSLVGRYLRGRGITISIPPSIRFHPSLKHTPSGLEFPTMVAALQAPGRTVVGIHRTYLSPDGGGKANIEPPKMALGPCATNAVRLAAATATLGLAEGIETALSAMQLYGDPVWAACGSNLAGVVIPDTVKHVVVYADNGEPGMRAATEAIETFCRQGRNVTRVHPADGFGDFNDLLQAKAESEAA